MRRLARKVSILSGIASFVAMAFFLTPAGAQTLSQGYDADSPLQKGMIVRLKENDASKVELVNSDDVEKLHGVIVDSNDAAATLSGEHTKVYVATAGRYSVLVSDQNGEIKPGDYITVSAISGIGMKADRYRELVLGRAMEEYNSSSPVLSTAQLKSQSGSVTEIHIGKIIVDLGVAKNPNLIDPTKGVPEILRRAGESVAGKQVQPVRIYLALVILTLATLLAVTMSYGGVSSGMVAIGRNPLNRKTITRNLIKIVLLGIAVFICGIAGSYILLRL